ncbi:MAG TPA: hypothetical protein VH189_14570 [Rhizomicrobium sp.]|nr:hypothetical protein [Rhizomicrobium sp.]
MEAALSTPPEWLERMVLLAIPPAARESVAGDLWETYRTPRQYAGEALRTVPFVILSQMRRNVNPAALMLQGALIFICLGGPATLVLLPVLMLRDAYQSTGRPCPRRAIREAILLSSSAMVLLFLFMSIHPPFPVRGGVDPFTWLSLFLAALFLSPFLCLFRAGLIMQGDRRMNAAARTVSKDALAAAYDEFLRGSFCRNVLEGVALAFAAAGGFFFAWNALLVGLFVLAAIYLLLDTIPRASLANDFVSLRAQYQRELTRQEHLRRFLRWLWFAPVLVALHTRLTDPAAGDSLIALLNCVATAILWFLVAALNREHGGRVREEIGQLDRVGEAR